MAKKKKKTNTKMLCRFLCLIRQLLSALATTLDNVVGQVAGFEQSVLT